MIMNFSLFSFFEGLGSCLYFIVPPARKREDIYPEGNNEMDWKNISSDFKSALRKLDGRRGE
jgi:hypothetical protein